MNMETAVCSHTLCDTILVLSFHEWQQPKRAVASWEKKTFLICKECNNYSPAVSLALQVILASLMTSLTENISTKP